MLKSVSCRTLLSTNKFSFGILGQHINDLYVFGYQDIANRLSFEYDFFALNSCNKSSIMYTLHSSNNSFDCITEAMFLHKRFGHLPLDKFKKLSLLFLNVHDHYVDCLICSQEKQHKLSFPKSQTNSSQVFDFINIDV